jgi:outer membrane protein
MKTLYNIFITLVLFNSNLLYAQEKEPPHSIPGNRNLFTLEQAISHALEHNHNIRISKLNEDIAANNVFWGNAGLLPQVFIEGSHSPALQYTELEFFGEVPPIVEPSAFSRVTNASAGLNYVLFDGFRNFYTLERLHNESNAAGAQARIDIENTVISLINAYFEVARLEQEFRINQNMLEISRRRFERAQSAFEFGGTRLDMLNAEVDLNTDSVNFIRTELNLNNGRRNLLVLMGLSSDSMISVETEVNLNEELDLEFVKEQALSNNNRLRLARINRNISELNVKIARSDIFPLLDINVAYNYNRLFNEAGFVQRQLISGVAGGVGVRYNLFNGRQRIVQTQNARISLDLQQQQLDQIHKEIDRDVRNSYENYRNSLYLLGLERRNIRTAQLNYERSEEAYSLGQISSTQLREAQLNLIRAEFRLVELLYQAKMAEVEIYRIAGILIK